MTRMRLLYWASTLPLCLISLAAAGFYLTHLRPVQDGFAAFGFPAALVPVLALAKIAGPLAILTRVSVRLGDLAYAGMFYHLLLAIFAHLNAGDGGYGAALLALGLMLVSFLTQNGARKVPSPNAPALPFPARPARPTSP